MALDKIENSWNHGHLFICASHNLKKMGEAEADWASWSWSPSTLTKDGLHRPGQVFMGR